MAYRWKPGASSHANLRRLARNQLRAALGELTEPDKQPAEAVHQARLHLKKLRALLRLVRAEAGSAFSEENARCRDISHELSRERDAQATLDALAHLTEHAERAWQSDASRLAALGDARQWLADRRRGSSASKNNFAGDLADRLRAALDDAERWTSRARDDNTIWAGLEQSYRRGRRALHRAVAEPTAEALHEWRKQVKYHRYHVRLFQDAWPAPLTAHYDELKRLSDLLGDDHDLVVLRQTLADAKDSLSSSALGDVAELIERRRTELCCQALPLGRMLYGEKPKQLARRLRGYWRVYASEE